MEGLCARASFLLGGECRSCALLGRTQSKGPKGMLVGVDDGGGGR